MSAPFVIRKKSQSFTTLKFINVDEKIFGVKVDNKHITPKSKFLPKINIWIHLEWVLWHLNHITEIQNHCTAITIEWKIVTFRMKSKKSEISFPVELGEPYGKRRVQAMALFALHWTKKHRSCLFAGDLINRWWSMSYDEVCVCLSLCVCVTSLNCVKTRFEMCFEFQKIVDK